MRAQADAVSLSLSRLPVQCYDRVVPTSLHYDAYALNGTTCSLYNPSCQMQLYPVCMLYLHVYGDMRLRNRD